MDRQDCRKKWMWHNLRYCSGMSLENPKKTARHFCQDGDCRGRDTNWASPEYKPEVLVLEPGWFVLF